MVIFGRVQVERDVKQTRGHVELSAAGGALFVPTAPETNSVENPKTKRK